MARSGYIRFGLGRGGETFPAQSFGTDPCTQTFINNWGWTDASWEAYVNNMVTYQGTAEFPQTLDGRPRHRRYLHHGRHGSSQCSPAKVALGNEGLETSDITNYPICSADWCNLWVLYKGKVPLELQTIAATDPTGNGPVGSLTTILPFAVTHGATVMEIYTDDWLLASIPTIPDSPRTEHRTRRLCGQQHKANRIHSTQNEMRRDKLPSHLFAPRLERHEVAG